MMRPRGYPPMPSAMSSPMLPDETTCTPSAREAPSLRRMIDPLPYSFSLVETARSTALLLFLGSSMHRARRQPRRAPRARRPPPPPRPAAGTRPSHPPPPVPAAPVASIARPLGVDAGELEPAIEPPPAAGDLGAELDAFTTVDACVAQRAA